MEFLIQKTHIKFYSYNDSLTQFVYDRKNTKLNLITIIKQTKVPLANPTDTASQGCRKPLFELNHGGPVASPGYDQALAHYEKVNEKFKERHNHTPMRARR